MGTELTTLLENIRSCFDYIESTNNELDFPISEEIQSLIVQTAKVSAKEENLENIISNLFEHIKELKEKAEEKSEKAPEVHNFCSNLKIFLKNKL